MSSNSKFAFAVVSAMLLISFSARTRAEEISAADVAALKAEIAELRGQIPSQSHAMMDVDYQFTNLWFAVRHGNWPLANFYLNETRSHLNWTVRLRPVRKLSNGADLPLAPILKSVEQNGLAHIKAALDAKDRKAFSSAYRQTIEECYQCHQAAEKPFLRPHIPDGPATRIVDMQPVDK
jgi:hypothetical protein